MFKRCLVQLYGMALGLCVLLLIAGMLPLGAVSANAGEAIIVPIHKVKVLKLDRDAEVVLIADPTIANVAVESERIIFLFGLEPGETSINIYDADGEEILVSPVVVVPLLERRVTINRANVNEEATYSCAPRCAAIATPVGADADSQKTGSGAGTVSSAASSGAGAGESSSEDSTGAASSTSSGASSSSTDGALSTGG